MDELAIPPRSTLDAGTSALSGREYYSIAAAATLLGVNRVSVWRWIRAGRLPIARLGHRTVRIARADLERLLAARAGGERRDGVVRSDGPHDHVVQFYEADRSLHAAAGAFLGAALRTGGAAVVVATAEHRAGLEERLAADGIDVGAAVAEGRYLALDAAETLARMMAGGAPDAQTFAAIIGGIIAQAGAGGRRVHAFGEMVALLAGGGNPAAALRLETLWNDLRTRRSFALLCAYPMARLGEATTTEVLGQICAAHGRVIPAESYSALPSAEAQRREVAALQRKAAQLETEIAERARAERQLRAALAAEREARAATEAALRIREDFLSIAAHELKTPITSLRASAQLAQRRLVRETPVKPERVTSALATVVAQSGKLTRLIDQLLDLSRLETGKYALERAPTDLTGLASQILADARARGVPHPLTLEAPPSLVASVDPLRLEQVLTNLLDNALKFSPEGGPIDVVLARREGRAELAVRDHGLGIPPEHRERLFERFFQAHAQGHRSGLGLGLYLSRQIAEQHGGTLRAEFPSDGGSRFVLTLPLAAAEPDTAWAPVLTAEGIPAPL
jgi:excisionase family DNA binding protein